MWAPTGFLGAGDPGQLPPHRGLRAETGQPRGRCPRWERPWPQLRCGGRPQPRRVQPPSQVQAWSSPRRCPCGCASGCASTVTSVPAHGACLQRPPTHRCGVPAPHCPRPPSLPASRRLRSSAVPATLAHQRLSGACCVRGQARPPEEAGTPTSPRGQWARQQGGGRVGLSGTGF